MSSATISRQTCLRAKRNARNALLGAKLGGLRIFRYSKVPDLHTRNDGLIRRCRPSRYWETSNEPRKQRVRRIDVPKRRQDKSRKIVWSTGKVSKPSNNALLLVEISPSTTTGGGFLSKLRTKPNSTSWGKGTSRSSKRGRGEATDCGEESDSSEETSRCSRSSEALT
jgi:hypothetical protein